MPKTIELRLSILVQLVHFLIAFLDGVFIFGGANYVLEILEKAIFVL